MSRRSNHTWLRRFDSSSERSAVLLCNGIVQPSATSSYEKIRHVLLIKTSRDIVKLDRSLVHIVKYSRLDL